MVRFGVPLQAFLSRRGFVTAEVYQEETQRLKTTLEALGCAEVIAEVRAVEFTLHGVTCTTTAKGSLEHASVLLEAAVRERSAKTGALTMLPCEQFFFDGGDVGTGSDLDPELTRAASTARAKFAELLQGADVSSSKGLLLLLAARKDQLTLTDRFWRIDDAWMRAASGKVMEGKITQRMLSLLPSESQRVTPAG